MESRFPDATTTMRSGDAFSFSENNNRPARNGTATTASLSAGGLPRSPAAAISELPSAAREPSRAGFPADRSRGRVCKRIVRHSGTHSGTLVDWAVNLHRKRDRRGRLEAAVVKFMIRRNISRVYVCMYVSRTRLRHREGLSIPLREGNIYGPGCKSRRQLAFTVTALRDMHPRG